MRQSEPYLRYPWGAAGRDRRIISGIIFLIRNELRWRDAPKEYGPHKTIYNRFIRWSRLGVFNRAFAALTAKGGKTDQLTIDATQLKAYTREQRAHRRRPLKKHVLSTVEAELFPDALGAPKAA